jgi:hypothetical protein
VLTSERGSIWRRWDLQVHTPFSHLNNSFGGDFPAYFRTLLSKARDHQISAVGVTDYFTIDGYREARRLVEDPEFLSSLPDDKVRALAGRILLLPNVELRTNFLIRDKQGKDSRVNMHVVFSDGVAVEDIEEHFFREVKFWSEAEPQKTAEKRSLTVANLTELGAKLKKQHQKFAGQTDIYVGMMNAVIDAHEVAKVLADHRSKFDRKYLIAFPCDEDLAGVSWDGQGHLSRKQYIQMADVLISSNESTRKFGLGHFHESPESFIEEFKSFKPSLHSSDAHTFDEMFVPAEGRFTWIKSDVTFDGLRQVLHEPEHRVFIGERPEQRAQIMMYPTRYIDSVTVGTRQGAPGDATWFPAKTIPLSPELVAIIGKKGSGKSALADIIGLAGNSAQAEHFSFLNPKRFWADNKRQARHYEGALIWHDRKERKVPLSQERDPALPETVKYIPQNYLELICNEIDQGTDSSFQKELQEVIFSHIAPDLRQGSTTLSELIALKNSAIQERLSLLKQQTRALTEKIIEAEERCKPVERTRLENLLADKKREIDAHNEIKPKEEAVDEARDKEEVSIAQGQLNQAALELEAAEKQVLALMADRRRLQSVRTECAGLLGSLQNLEIGFKALYDKVDERAKVLGIRASDLVKISVDRNLVNARDREAQTALAEVEGKLVPTTAGTPAHALAAAKAKAEGLRKKLTEPEKKRQALVQAKLAWEKRMGELVGTPELPGSLRHLERRAGEFQSLPTLISQLREQRESSMLSQYDCIIGLAKEYEELFNPVKQYFEDHKSMYPEVSAGFIVKQRVKGFTAGLLSYIDQNKRGSFRGTEDGHKVANELVSKADFQTREGVRAFVDSVMKKIEPSSATGSKIEDQLGKGKSKLDLLNFVYDLDYIRPRFDLLWDGKHPELLSPGERGSLLLVFYLVLDMRRTPLVIDQPEENLDNETIYKVLVPCIMFAKRRRQVVMVTHNPNLAVAADADQIIYASMKKNPGNELGYESGAIENPVITEHIINVLEGTRPAFMKREARYDII